MNKEVEQGYIKEIENLKAKNRVLEQKIEAIEAENVSLVYRINRLVEHIMYKEGN